MSQSNRPVYTEAQVGEFLDYIGVSDHISKEQCDTDDGLKYLNMLLPRYMSKIPFENLDLHYSPYKQASVDTGVLYHKIVGRKAGRGGYCFQNNLFCGTMLRAMGYKVMSAGARVSSAFAGTRDPNEIRYTGWVHMVNIVHIGGKRYLCDVGFGGKCPSLAIPLEDGWIGRQSWNTFDDKQLKWDHILENTFRTEAQKMWIYYHRFGEDLPFMPMYCFTEVEFLPQDFEAMNNWVSRSLTSFFTYSVVVRKCILDNQGQDVGELTLRDTVVKEAKYGTSRVLAELKSEEERVRALKEHFGITLDTSEVNGIQDLVTMIRSTPPT